MKLLADWTIRHGDAERKIQLLQGDLTRLPPEHAVDVLVVSAFLNNYQPTPGSLIGALDRAGLSVSSFSKDKQADLRQEYSCWLSKQIEPGFNFRHILCIESGWRGSMPEITDDLFRALAPYLLTEFKNAAVAMPLIGAGKQFYPPEKMLEAILRAGVSWIQRGLPLQLLKMVTYWDSTAQKALAAFTSFKSQYQMSTEQVSLETSVPFVADQPEVFSAPSSASYTASQYDVFLSYAHEDKDMANYIAQRLKELSPGVHIFHDQISLKEGVTWLMQIAEALDSSRRVIALYSENYWLSKNCQMEFLAAFTRQIDTGEAILFPVYLSEAKIPFMFRNLQYSDCKVNDRIKLASACSRLIMNLS